MPATTLTAAVSQYELSVSIDAGIDRVWKSLIEEIDQWWLPDFHMTASDSKVSLDIQPGGLGLHEIAGDGSFLKWFDLQCVLPQQYKLYLIGHLAPEWGGPTTSSLGFALESDGDSTTVRMTEALHGKVADATSDSQSSGWLQLLEQGLKAHVEAGQGR